MEFAKIFAEVPTNVSVPPSIDKNESGMSNFVAGVFDF